MGDSWSTQVSNPAVHLTDPRTVWTRSLSSREQTVGAFRHVVLTVGRFVKLFGVSPSPDRAETSGQNGFRALSPLPQLSP